MATILLWLHFISLSVGGAALFGNPVLRRAMSGASADARPALLGAARTLTIIGRGALVVLILTGVGMVLRGEGFGAMPFWFWIKLVLVAALIVGIVQVSLAGKRAVAGDAAASARVGLWARINIALIAGVLLCAVLAFG